MSGRVSISFVDFALFSFDFDRVCCGSARPFLVRNWCGANLYLKGRDACGSVSVASRAVPAQPATSKPLASFAEGAVYFCNESETGAELDRGWREVRASWLEREGHRSGYRE